MPGHRPHLMPSLCALAISIPTYVMISNSIQPSGGAVAQSAASSEIAAHGKLRVALPAFNPILMAQRPNGSIGGIAVDLGKLIADRLRQRFGLAAS